MHHDLPKMKPLTSSNVEAVGHHAGRSELHVRFKGGGHYIYDGIDAELHEKLLKAESVGKFIGEHVKGKFSFRKL